MKMHLAGLKLFAALHTYCTDACSFQHTQTLTPVHTIVLHTSMTARNEYSGPSLHTWVARSPLLSDLDPTIFCLLPLNVFSMLPSVSPPQCKVGALFKPLLPLTHMQEKDLPMMLNSVEPPSMLQPQPKSHAKSQPLTRPSSNSLNNGGTL